MRHHSAPLTLLPVCGVLAVALAGSPVLSGTPALAHDRTSQVSARVVTEVPGSRIRVDFDDLTPALARTIGDQARTPMRVTGDPQLQGHLVSFGGAGVKSASDGRGGYAARLPGLGSDRAVLTVTATASSRSLTPGARAFTFGSRFRLDDRSEGLNKDNGNNLIQRGLWTDVGQYKLQVDRGRVSCRVAGRSGAVTVVSPVVVAPGAWHRATCRRDAGLVQLSVGKPDGTVIRTNKYAPTGDVALSSQARLAVGGKVTSSGEVVRGDADQFNGVVDDVFVSIPRSG